MARMEAAGCVLSCRSGRRHVMRGVCKIVCWGDVVRRASSGGERYPGTAQGNLQGHDGNRNSPCLRH